VVNYLFAPENIEQHLRPHGAGTNGIDPDPVLPILHGGGFSQAQDRVLACRINTSCWGRYKSANGGRVYNRAALSLSDHLLHLGLEQEEQGLDIHGKYVVEVFFCLIHEQAVLAGRPGVVERVIQPPESPKSERQNEPHLLRITQICL